MIKEDDKFRPSSLFEGMTSIRAVLRAADAGTNDRRIREILYDKELTKSHFKEINYLSKIAPARGFTLRELPHAEIAALAIGSSHGGILADCTERTLPELAVALHDEILPDGFYAMLGLTDKAGDIMRTVDKLDKIGAEKVRTLLTDEVGVSAESADEILKFIAITGSNDQVLSALEGYAGRNETFDEGLDQLKTVVKYLSAFGVPEENFAVDLTIARGLDYYTGTVFEVFDEAPENNRAMFGGGRYDNLVGLFVKNTNISGVGFGFGDVTLENFLVTHNLIPDIYNEGTKVLVARFNDVPYEKYMALTDALRAAGVPASLYLGEKKFGKQIDYAVKGAYSHVAILGGDEAARGVVKIKNLRTREETEVQNGELAAYFNA
mgnify:CR=1 FL=1